MGRIHPYQGPCPHIQVLPQIFLVQILEMAPPALYLSTQGTASYKGYWKRTHQVTIHPSSATTLMKVPAALIAPAILPALMTFLTAYLVIQDMVGTAL